MCRTIIKTNNDTSCFQQASSSLDSNMSLPTIPAYARMQDLQIFFVGTKLFVGKQIYDMTVVVTHGFCSFFVFSFICRR